MRNSHSEHNQRFLLDYLTTKSNIDVSMALASTLLMNFHSNIFHKGEKSDSNGMVKIFIFSIMKVGTREMNNCQNSFCFVHLSGGKVPYVVFRQIKLLSSVWKIYPLVYLEHGTSGAPSSAVVVEPHFAKK